MLCGGCRGSVFRNISVRHHVLPPWIRSVCCLENEFPFSVELCWQLHTVHLYVCMLNIYTYACYPFIRMHADHL